MQEEGLGQHFEKFNRLTAGRHDARFFGPVYFFKKSKKLELEPGLVRRYSHFHRFTGLERWQISTEVKLKCMVAGRAF